MCQGKSDTERQYWRVLCQASKMTGWFSVVYHLIPAPIQGEHKEVVDACTEGEWGVVV